jgi:hypothetical protein
MSDVCIVAVCQDSRRGDRSWNQISRPVGIGRNSVPLVEMRA